MSETTAYRYRPSLGLSIARGVLTSLIAGWVALAIAVGTHLTIWGTVLVPVTGAAIVAAWTLLDRLQDRHFDRSWIVAAGAEGFFSEKELRRFGIRRTREQAPASEPDAGSIDPGDRSGQNPVAPVSAGSDALLEGEHGDEQA